MAYLCLEDDKPTKPRIELFTVVMFMKSVAVAIFGFIFRSFLVVWQKNDQNGLKNEVKSDVTNGYCEHSVSNANILKMKQKFIYFYLPLAMLSTFKLSLKGLHRIVHRWYYLTVSIFLSIL